MSLPVRFAPYSVDINTAGGTSAWINQVQGTDVEQNVTLFEESGGSQTDREFVAIKEVAPTIPIETTDLSMLATIGMAGVSVTPASSAPGVIVYARDIPNQSLPAATSSAVHVAMAVSDGLLEPVTVSANHNTTAKFQMMLHAILGSTPTYSGATPVVCTASSTIASGAGATLNVYTGGVVKYTISGGASRLVKGVIGQQVQFGIKVRKEGTDGESHVTFICIERRYPELMFVTDDIELTAEVGEGLSLSSFAMFFTAVSQNGQRVAAATTSHVSVTGTEGILTPTKTSLAFQKSGNAAFKFTPSLNTNLLTISTSAAIPTS